jgi:hypothetical protein
MDLSDSVQTRLERLFGNQVDVAASLLVDSLRPWEHLDRYESLLTWVVDLSAGDLDRLRYFAARAHDYPTDIYTLVQHNPALGKFPERKQKSLKGGPATLDPTERAPGDREENLFEKTAFAMVCVVCDKLVPSGKGQQSPVASLAEVLKFAAL